VFPHSSGLRMTGRLSRREFCDAGLSTLALASLVRARDAHFAALAGQERLSLELAYELEQAGPYATPMR
jgi:hypothetical protein